MDLFRLKIKNNLCVILILLSQVLFAQNKGVVLDVNTNNPIQYVNIYTSNNKKVSGTISDTNGRFNINFSCEELTFSHINYEKTRITYSELSDTVYLSPKTNILTEVIVDNTQPDWIKKVLERFISKKKHRYRVSGKNLSYKYNTRTVSDTSGYAFTSEGVICVPPFLSSQPFRISPNLNIIKYKDISAGVDFSNMQRIIYDKFIEDFNRRFIKGYEFIQNHGYNGADKNIIQLIFNSKENYSDSGTIVIDTTQCVILEAERYTGTDFNLKRQTSGALRALASQTKGFNYHEWITYSYIRYEKLDDTYFPIDCRYKLYMKTSAKKKRKIDSFFISTESELLLINNEPHAINDFVNIPQPYYMLFIKSKSMREEEEKLHNVPVKFEIF